MEVDRLSSRSPSSPSAASHWYLFFISIWRKLSEVILVAGFLCCRSLCKILSKSRERGAAARCEGPGEEAAARSRSSRSGTPREEPDRQHAGTQRSRLVENAYIKKCALPAFSCNTLN